MQKNLRWKLILILALMVICIYYFVSPREKGAACFPDSTWASISKAEFTLFCR